MEKLIQKKYDHHYWFKKYTSMSDIGWDGLRKRKPCEEVTPQSLI